MTDIALIIAGLIVMVLGGDWLLKAAIGLSLRMDVPKIVIGMTVVSFATSAPELVVSLKAASEGHSDLAVGNVVGSNIVNLGLVLGVVLLIAPIYIQESFYKTDWPMLMFSSVLVYYFALFDGEIQQFEGVIMFLLIVVFLVYLFKFEQKAVVVDEVLEEQKVRPLKSILLYFGIGGVSLWAGSELLIEGAISIAKYYKVSERVIGLTMVSIGTGLPELTASVMAALRKEKAISIGNLLGSNIFNLFVVLGLTAVVDTVKIVDPRLWTNDIYWMLLLSFILLPLVFIPSRMKLGWKEGVLLILIYVLFIWSL